MSAPLVVNTRDGVCWTRRTVTSGGIALYAPEGVKTCPNFVMATLAELAEHGIAGSADALPMPAGSALDKARRAASELLRQTTGADLPQWRAVFDTDETIAEPNAIAPVCTDDDHEPGDGSVYDCCPDPVVVVDPPLVAYLVALLNADRTAMGGAS